ncbi:MAG: hypothetical protein KDB21_05490 [Acidimicrobiales bacterium]|nr:hypothetical protein [Acidimicrobiales bacterium]
MDPTITDLFERSGSNTITVRGRVVRALVRLPVRDGTVVRIARIRCNEQRPEALKLALDSGVLDVNGIQAAQIGLWSDTSPEEVVVRIRGEQASALDVWNAWLIGGVDTSWLGNAGIVSKAIPDGQALHCSDGIGPPDFTDLVVEVHVKHPSTEGDTDA